MGEHNPRTLDSMGKAHWSFGSFAGMITWAWSRDWKSRHPWSYAKRNLPYVGVSRRIVGPMTSFYFTLGPMMFGLHSTNKSALETVDE